MNVNHFWLRLYLWKVQGWLTVFLDFWNYLEILKITLFEHMFQGLQPHYQQKDASYGSIYNYKQSYGLKINGYNCRVIGQNLGVVS